MSFSTKNRRKQTFCYGCLFLCFRVKILQSGTFYYHIRNVATYSFFFSFSYCNLTEFKILSIYNLDSTIISNLGISYMCSTPFMKKRVYNCPTRLQMISSFFFNLVRRHQSLCHHKRGFRCNYTVYPLCNRPVSSTTESLLVIDIIVYQGDSTSYLSISALNFLISLTRLPVPPSGHYQFI